MQGGRAPRVGGGAASVASSGGIRERQLRRLAAARDLMPTQADAFSGRSAPDYIAALMAGGSGGQ